MMSTLSLSLMDDQCSRPEDGNSSFTDIAWDVPDFVNEIKQELMDNKASQSTETLKIESEYALKYTDQKQPLIKMESSELMNQSEQDYSVFSEDWGIKTEELYVKEEDLLPKEIRCKEICYDKNESAVKTDSEDINMFEQGHDLLEDEIIKQEELDIKEEDLEPNETRTCYKRPISTLTNKELIMIAILLDEEEEKEKKTYLSRRCWIRDILKKRKSEGEYWTLYPELADNEEKFCQYFRMTSFQFNELLGKIENSITKKNTHFRQSLKPREKLAVCIRYLVTGESFTTIAFSFRMGETSARNAVKEVCSAIVDNMLNEVIPIPTSQQWEKNIEKFWTTWNFPNCLGAIGGKHVVILVPPKSGSQQYSYKKTYSIVLLALVNAENNFIAVDVGAYGEYDDWGIFAKSNIGKALSQNKFNIPEKKCLPGTTIDASCVIAGDEAFPLKENLLRPYPRSQLIDNAKKIQFNHRLSRARSVVDTAVGILGETFRIYNRRMHLNPQSAEVVVLTTCILHNFIRQGSCTPTADKPSFKFNNIRKQGGNAVSVAFEARNRFADFFMSPQGELN